VTTDFGQRLRERRDELGMKRQELADLSGLSYAYVTQLESGRKSSPSQTVVSLLAQALRLSAEELADSAGTSRTEPPRSRRASAPAASGARWHANPAHVPPPAMAMMEEVSAPVTSSSELRDARAQVLPAVERLLAPYSPTTRLALLNELQQQALRELGAG
jgi:transcriptional regulator with XRE-family HTH domain